MCVYDYHDYMNLEEKLYTSTEVAQILGVSLRSVYRYMEEGKLDAEVKTATGRHRFTKQDILNFLYPKNDNQSPTREVRSEQAPFVSQQPTAPRYSAQPQAPVIERKNPEPVMSPKAAPIEVAQPVEEAPVDWLAKFREAASKFKTESANTSTQASVQTPVAAQPAPVIPQQPAYETHTNTVSGISDFSEAPVEDTNKYYYYRSMLGGLKDIAQNIDKSSKRSFVDYAFTLNAGLSLHKPIKPFSILHVYIKDHDKGFFEKVLNLVSADSREAQLCLISTSDPSIFSEKREMHGLYVVADKQLRKDLINAGELSLASELDH